MGTATTQDADSLAALAEVLEEALWALGASGQPEAANRLAGRAYVALRGTHPDLAERVNVLMHRVARMPERNEGADHA